MSNEAMGWVWNHSPYTGSQLLVHLAIADVVNDLHNNEFYMSTEKLARKAKVSRSTVVTALGDMVERGLLAVLVPGGDLRKPTRYQFTTSALADLASADWPSELARPPRAIPKNPTDEPKEAASAESGLVDFSLLADAECVSCNGRGWRYHPGAGRDARCECTKTQATA